MHVSDAIAYTSFLRSTIAAHSNENKSYLRVLSVYEVSNVQFLARRLLLESLGYWRYLGTHENALRLKGPKERSRTKPRRIAPRVREAEPAHNSADQRTYPKVDSSVQDLEW